MEIEVTLVSNADEWVFENVNVGYKFSFLSGKRVDASKSLSIKGFYSDRVSYFSELADNSRINPQLVLGADEFATLPSVSNARDLNLWAKLLSFPVIGDGRLDSSRQDIVCAPNAEIHVSLEGSKGVFTGNVDDHAVYNHLNVGRYSFDKSVGAFNYADYELYLTSQEQIGGKLALRAGSALSLYGLPRLIQKGHPIRHPRIAFRDVVHASNQRKVWAALVPSATLLTNKAPYLIFGDTSIEAQAYLLGMLNSGPIDWYISLKFGLNLNYFIFYTIPVPTYTGSNRQLRIAELAARLATAGKEDFGDWSTFGNPIDLLNERATAMAEVDYLCSLEFGLTKDEVGIIFDSGNTERSTMTEVLSFGKLEGN
jgi:hypothetical protein